MGLDWKPRHRDIVIGNIPWLARITDKARAKIEGTLGDYVYPWPADQKFLEELKVKEEKFTEIVQDNPSDEDMIAAIRSLRD